MAVCVVTDSAADLTDTEAAALGVRVVPLSIRFGTEEFVDRQDLTPAEFYARCAASPVLPETAAPSPGAFQAAFQSAFDEGADAVVCINISSGLSATMASAQNAARSLEGRDIRIIDSRSITWGLGSMAATAATAATAAAGGASADEVVAVVEDMIPRQRVYGSLDTLENLKKGGRIGGAQAMIGSLLNLKPLISIEGVVEEAGRARTRSRALKGLVEKVREAGEIENVGVMHGSAPDFEEFLDMLAVVHPRERIHVGEIGATIGVHGGPRVMGVTFQVIR